MWGCFFWLVCVPWIQMSMHILRMYNLCIQYRIHKLKRPQNVIMIPLSKYYFLVSMESKLKSCLIQSKLYCWQLADASLSLVMESILGLSLSEQFKWDGYFCCCLYLLLFWLRSVGLFKRKVLIMTSFFNKDCSYRLKEIILVQNEPIDNLFLYT